MYNAFLALTMIIKGNISIYKIKTICNHIICMCTYKYIDIKAYNIIIINFIIIKNTYLLNIILLPYIFENDP